MKRKIVAKHRRFPRTNKIIVDIEAPATIIQKIYVSVITVIESQKDGHYNTYDIEVKGV